MYCHLLFYTSYATKTKGMNGLKSPCHIFSQSLVINNYMSKLTNVAIQSTALLSAAMCVITLARNTKHIMGYSVGIFFYSGYFFINYIFCLTICWRDRFHFFCSLAGYCFCQLFPIVLVKLCFSSLSFLLSIIKWEADCHTFTCHY